MPLDSGGLNDVQGEAGGGEPRLVESYAPTIHSGTDIGEALRAMREYKGLTLASLAEITRVRSSYLAAIEAMRLDQLPSRPFVIGYIRAYAQALGADAEQAVNRFKAEEPVLDEPLPEPVGMGDDRDPRLAAIIAAAVVIVVAIVAWNVVQRIMTETAPASPTASDTSSARALANTTAGPVALGAPLPAPVESTTPPPYETPGLSKAVNAEGQPLMAPQAAAAPPPGVTLPAVFTPQGTVYGVSASQASVTLQALKPAFLVIHGADGSIYFARQLNAGEAYRAPNIAGLTVDVSEPEAFQAFSGGQSKGVLPQPLTPIAKLVIPVAAPPAAAPPVAPKPVAPQPTAAAATPKPVAAKPATATSKPATAAARPKTAKPTPLQPKAKADAPQADAEKTDPPF
ncbi:MAG: putative transcriptional regulator [Phenylobacterium sp.]|nr:putative transcriptional regulator [Phenylobacterium sp.]